MTVSVIHACEPGVKPEYRTSDLVRLLDQRMLFDINEGFVTWDNLMPRWLLMLGSALSHYHVDIVLWEGDPPREVVIAYCETKAKHAEHFPELWRVIPELRSDRSTTWRYQRFVALGTESTDVWEDVPDPHANDW